MSMLSLISEIAKYNENKSLAIKKTYVMVKESTL